MVPSSCATHVCVVEFSCCRLSEKGMTSLLFTSVRYPGFQHAGVRRFEMETLFHAIVQLIKLTFVSICPLAVRSQL
jgi:hypothetical protein